MPFRYSQASLEVLVKIERSFFFLLFSFLFLSRWEILSFDDFCLDCDHLGSLNFVYSNMSDRTSFVYPSILFFYFLEPILLIIVTVLVIIFGSPFFKAWSWFTLGIMETPLEILYPCQTCVWYRYVTDTSKIMSNTLKTVSYMPRNMSNKTNEKKILCQTVSDFLVGCVFTVFEIFAGCVRKKREMIWKN